VNVHILSPYEERGRGLFNPTEDLLIQTLSRQIGLSGQHSEEFVPYLEKPGGKTIQQPTEIAWKKTLIKSVKALVKIPDS
jgi:hypothetical protein